MKIVICGNYGAKNLGDELILEGILKSLKAIAPNAQLTVLSATPQETAKKYNIASAYKFASGFRSLFRPRKATKAAVKECDFFILGGGGLFLSLKFTANIIWAIQALRAYWYKRTVIMYGQSIGQTNNPILKALVGYLFNKAFLITVRDLDSKENLRTIGVENEIHVIPDPAFRIENIKIPDERENYAVVALRQMRGLGENLIAAVAEFIVWLRDVKKLDIKMVNFQEGPDSDGILHEAVLSHIDDKKNIEIIGNTSDPFPIFAKAKCALCMRLHSVIAAIKTNTDFTAINYAPKVKAVLKDARLDEHSLLNMDDVTLQTLKTHFERNQDIQKYNEEALHALKEFEQTILDSTLKA